MPCNGEGFVDPCQEMLGKGHAIDTFSGCNDVRADVTLKAESFHTIFDQSFGTILPEQSSFLTLPGDHNSFIGAVAGAQSFCTVVPEEASFHTVPAADSFLDARESFHTQPSGASSFLDMSGILDLAELRGRETSLSDRAFRREGRTQTLPLSFNSKRDLGGSLTWKDDGKAGREPPAGAVEQRCPVSDVARPLVQRASGPQLQLRSTTAAGRQTAAQQPRHGLGPRLPLSCFHRNLEPLDEELSVLGARLPQATQQVPAATSPAWSQTPLANIQVAPHARGRSAQQLAGQRTSKEAPKAIGWWVTHSESRWAAPA